MRTLNVSEQGYEKLLKIQKMRPQDKSRAETFDHIIKIYELKRSEAS
jgi:hypothetical protein